MTRETTICSYCIYNYQGECARRPTHVHVKRPNKHYFLASPCGDFTPENNNYGGVKFVGEMNEMMKQRDYYERQHEKDKKYKKLAKERWREIKNLKSLLKSLGKMPNVDG
jgi:hypothetical protein